MKVELAKVKGEMQTMNWKMADGISTLHWETTESRGSVDVVRTAMTTGEVEAMSDVTKIKKMQELKEVTETHKSKGEDELHKIKEEHTQI